jgi:hypothetical protein
MSSSDEHLIEAINNASIVLHRYVIPIIYVIATIGNLLSVIIFATKSWRKNVCVLYFVVCLFFNTCYINSTMLGSMFIFGYNINLLNSSVILCKLYSYLSFLFSTIYPTILILASIDRLLISSKDVDTRLYSSKRLAYFSIGISTFCWTVYFFHLLIMINIQQLFPSYFVCFYDPSGSYRAFVSYSSLIINSSFFIIMIILSIFAFKNVRQILSIPRNRRQQIRSMTKKDVQLLRCLFVHDIFYIVFSVFISVYMVYAVVTADRRRTLLEQAIVNLISNLSTFLHHIPFCASSFIFYGMSKAFRRELKRIIYRMVGKEIASLSEAENIDKNNIVLDDNGIQTITLPIA